MRRSRFSEGAQGEQVTEVTETDRAAWLASGPIDWAEESYQITISPETGYCARTGTGCWYDEGRERLEPGELKRTIRA